MLKTIVATAAAALISFIAMQPANAGGGVNGQAWNGQAWNGQAWNGQAWNGQAWNGQAWNGQAWNGIQLQAAMPSGGGFVVTAIELPPAKQ